MCVLWRNLWVLLFCLLLYGQESIPSLLHRVYKSEKGVARDRILFFSMLLYMFMYL